jgi:dsRNA-specific ribonuclease
MNRVVHDPVHMEISKLLPEHNRTQKFILEYIQDVIDDAVRTEQQSDPHKEPEKYAQDHKLVKELEKVVRAYILMEKKSNAATEALKSLQKMGVCLNFYTF